MKKNIVILGPLGQDGKLLSSILEKEKYNLFGITKENTNHERILLHQNDYGSKIYSTDLSVYSNVENILNRISPNIIVNFAVLLTYSTHGKMLIIFLNKIVEFL